MRANASRPILTVVEAKQAPKSARATDAAVIERPDGQKHLTPLYANAFLGLVRAGEGLARDLDAELEREHAIGLRAFEVLLMLTVFAPEGRLRVTELTVQAPLSQSRVSRLVAELEAQGMVKRARAADDGRGVSVTITNAGREKFKAAQETHLVGLDRRLFSRLTGQEIRQLATITAKITARTPQRESHPPSNSRRARTTLSPTPAVPRRGGSQPAGQSASDRSL